MARPTIHVDVKTIQQMYAAGLSTEKIAKQVGACPETVRKRLKNTGVLLRPARCPKLDTNRPLCRNGHNLHGRNKYVSKNGRITCRQCRNAQAKQHYKSIRQYQLRCIKADPDLQSAKSLRQRLCKSGLSIPEYRTQFKQQEGRCALCRQLETEVFRGKVRLLAVDHNRATGRRRGLLCRRCNCILGMFNDDPILFQLAIEYLKKWTETAP